MSLSAEVFLPIQGWRKEHDVIELCLAVDIDGSGLRIRVSNAVAAGEFVDLGHIKANGAAQTY
jgi:hypothetical protein